MYVLLPSEWCCHKDSIIALHAVRIRHLRHAGWHGNLCVICIYTGKFQGPSEMLYIYILPDFLFYFISVSVPMHNYLRQRPFWIISYSLSFTFEACNLHIKTLINSKVLMVSQWYIKLKYVGYRRSIARLWYLLPNVFFFIQNCIQISDIRGLVGRRHF